MCQIQFKLEEGYAIITLTGELTLSSSNDVKERAKQFVSQHNATKVILDLSQLEMVDSSGLGTLIALFKHVNQNQGSIVYSGATDYVLKIFGFAKLDKIFILARNTEEAKMKL